METTLIINRPDEPEPLLPSGQKLTDKREFADENNNQGNDILFPPGFVNRPCEGCNDD